MWNNAVRLGVGWGRCHCCWHKPNTACATLPPQTHRDDAWSRSARPGRVWLGCAWLHILGPLLQSSDSGQDQDQVSLWLPVSAVLQAKLGSVAKGADTQFADARTLVHEQVLWLRAPILLLGSDCIVAQDPCAGCGNLLGHCRCTCTGFGCHPCACAGTGVAGTNTCMAILLLLLQRC